MGVIFTRGQEPSWVFSSPAGPVPPRTRVRRVLRPGPIPLTRPGWLRPDLDIIVLPPPARVRCSPLAPRQPPRLGEGTQPEDAREPQDAADAQYRETPAPTRHRGPVLVEVEHHAEDAGRDGAGAEAQERPDGQHRAEPRGRHGLGDPGGVDGRIAERRETVETSGHENQRERGAKI